MVGGLGSWLSRRGARLSERAIRRRNRQDRVWRGHPAADSRGGGARPSASCDPMPRPLGRLGLGPHHRERSSCLFRTDGTGSTVLAPPDALRPDSVAGPGAVRDSGNARGTLDRRDTPCGRVALASCWNGENLAFRRLRPSSARRRTKPFAWDRGSYGSDSRLFLARFVCFGPTTGIRRPTLEPEP